MSNLPAVDIAHAAHIEQYGAISRAELLNLLAQHQGAANGIRMAELVVKAHTDERTLRSLVSELREEGVAVCATPAAGYFMAQTPAELAQTCAFLHNRAMHSLRTASRLQKISLPDLMGQLLLNQA